MKVTHFRWYSTTYVRVYLLIFFHKALCENVVSNAWLRNVLIIFYVHWFYLIFLSNCQSYLNSFLFLLFISADRYTVTNAIEESTSILNDALTAMTQLPITKIHQALANDIQQFQAKLSSVSDDDTLSEICKDIVGTVWKAVSAGNDSKSQSSKFEKMCSAFHSISISGDTQEKVKLLTQRIEVRLFSGSFFVQYFITEIYRCLIGKKSDLLVTQQSVTAIKPVERLGETEEQAVRYVAGYVCFRLQQTFKRQNTIVGASCSKLIASWHLIPDDSSKTFLSFTRKWMEKVNRGGLFQITDDVHILFRRMELVVKPCLDKSSINYLKDVDNIESCLVEKVLKNVLVQHSFSKLLESVDNDSIKAMITSKLIHSWITIRVNGFVKSYMFIRKTENRKLSKKAEKSLRRELSKAKDF